MTPSARQDSSRLIDQLTRMALAALPIDRAPSEEEVADAVARLARAFNADGAVEAAVLRTVQARRLIRMDTGYAVAEKHTPWLNARRPSIDAHYWTRLKEMLLRDWAPGVVLGLDRSTDEILDLLGDPANEDTWKRRGLVMGDVQSGKTATYSALITKAADAGYRFIVLLTGTIENLRRQTQERLDAAFVGFDSSEQLRRSGQNMRLIGVGLLNRDRQATVFTSSSSDFRVSTLRALGLSLTALREPALVVIKKHTKILANLREWLKSYNDPKDLNLPMLLIDDEADNASINTSEPENDPTAVNRGIRELLGLFRRTSYVGFTATPFANIFISPESQEEMLGDDLFPRDFIYTLEAPTNYVGPQRYFGDGGDGATLLNTLDDLEDLLPVRHKAGFTVVDVPLSMVDAVRCFLVANAIRDLRGEGASHRSMLVNVSQFTKVQDQIESILHAKLDVIQTAVRSFSALPEEEALRDHEVHELNRVWKEQYSNCGFSWGEVQRALHDAVLQVTTKAVNQRTGPMALDYRSHREHGLRVIAVGGNSLSRGLTLEGLMTSYFRRSTQMYDTLLQMGRWFGYRPGYEDLCRVWMTQDAIDWYGHITEVTEELREELRRMWRLGKTPKDFGLMVRAHPQSLLVTARNKMRTAAEITRTVSLSGSGFESVELPNEEQQIRRNWEATKAFAQKLVADEAARGRSDFEGRILVSNVPREQIAGLLRSFTVPATEFVFQPDAIAELLARDGSGVLDRWDVAIPTGDGAIVDLGIAKFKSQRRSIVREPSPDRLVVSGDKRRVGSRGAESAGLNDEQKAQARLLAEAAAEKKASDRREEPPAKVNVADRFYRQVRTRPLLLLHFMEAVPSPASEAHHFKIPDDCRLVAIGLSFPVMPEDASARQVTYKINLVKARELFGEGDGSLADDVFADEVEP